VREAAVDDDREKFWATVPDKAVHPRRVSMLEALRYIGEPLSAVTIVDVLNGDVSMWDASHDLSILKQLGVVEPASTDIGQGNTGDERFDRPYQLKSWKSGRDH
jgi:hypothetical protein